MPLRMSGESPLLQQLFEGEREVLGPFPVQSPLQPEARRVSLATGVDVHSGESGRGGADVPPSIGANRGVARPVRIETSAGPALPGP